MALVRVYGWHRLALIALLCVAFAIALGTPGHDAVELACFLLWIASLGEASSHAIRQAM